MNLSSSELERIEEMFASGAAASEPPEAPAGDQIVDAMIRAVQAQVDARVQADRAAQDRRALDQLQREAQAVAERDRAAREAAARDRAAREAADRDRAAREAADRDRAARDAADRDLADRAAERAAARDVVDRARGGGVDSEGDGPWKTASENQPRSVEELLRIRQSSLQR